MSHFQPMRSVNKPPTSLVSISPYPTPQDHLKQPQKISQDLGAIRNMVAGWERNQNASRSGLILNTNTLSTTPATSSSISTPSTPGVYPGYNHNFSSSPSASSTINVNTNGTTITPTSPSVSIKAARDAFFIKPNPPSPSGTLNRSSNEQYMSSCNTTNTLPRFASVERLSQRQNIYDSGVITTAINTPMKSPSPEPPDEPVSSSFS